jgi:hypothetical protein
MTGFVLLKPPQWFLLVDWTWATAADLLRFRWPAVAVFASYARADRARRTYGRRAWRAMTILPITGGNHG